MKKEIFEANTRVARRLACALSTLASIGMGMATANAQPQTIYKETYTFCTGTILGAEAAAQAGWLGLVSGLPQAKISNLKVFAYGNLEIGGSVNSNPVGLSQGYSFWFKPVYGLTVLTREFPFDVGLIKNSNATVQYAQRLSGIDPTGQANKTQLAFLIDNTWYISQEFSRQTKIGIWESVQFSPAALTYAMVPSVEGRGPAIPTVYNSPLPAAGTVRAFGVFLDEVNGRVRVDNFKISTVLPAGSLISTAVQTSDVMQCPADSPDRTGDGDPQDPPDEDDQDTDPDQDIPEDPKPTPFPTLTPGPIEDDVNIFSFCPIKQQGTGRKVQISRQTMKAMLRKVKRDTLVNQRDRAIITLLGQRAMPLGAFVNMKVGDFDASSTILTASTRAGARPLKLKLRRTQLGALQQYLGTTGAPKESGAPLFLSSASQVHHSVTLTAVCSTELKRMLRTRAVKAKVAVAGITRRSR